MVGGLDAGRPRVFLETALSQNLLGFFVNLGHVLPFSRISIGVRFS